MSSRPGAPAAAARGADVIRAAFDRQRRDFRRLTRQAQRGFEARDWAGVRRLTVERLDLHAKHIGKTFARLRSQLGERIAERRAWAAMKSRYTHAILGRDDLELAQTFFNSLSRKAFFHVGVDPAIDYVADDIPLPYRGWELASARVYAVRRLDASVLTRVLESCGLRAPWSDLEGDAVRAAARLEQGIVERHGSPQIEALDVLRPIFVRNKAAYVVARARRGPAVSPVVMAIVNREDGLAVDAVLDSEDETSIVFSFARWYFHADIGSPREVIGFLQSILPRKEVAELYISLGYHKHGKTELYRELMTHVNRERGCFVVAPGQPGLVMAVFHLPSYEFVFKVIKDVFPPVKKTSRRQVMERYREVLRHDRVGRLVDFQEFEHVTVPSSRFSPELLVELLAVAGKTVHLRGDKVLIDHMYVGRRVTPLDIYLQQASAAEAEAAVVDWGQALRDLAAANIFTGDILIKNFGVTRHGRVVSYDYDELRLLTACNFRRFPTARGYDDELADAPWFSVAESDVFPEELRTFLGLRSELREVFARHHADLFEIEPWQAMQERNRRGEILDVYPYPETRRLRGRSPVVA